MRSAYLPANAASAGLVAAESRKNPLGSREFCPTGPAVFPGATTTWALVPPNPNEFTPAQRSGECGSNSGLSQTAGLRRQKSVFGLGLERCSELGRIP